jgi:hypothetical protein
MCFLFALVLFVAGGALGWYMKPEPDPPPYLAPPPFKECPHCSEPVRFSANVCRHCNRSIITAPPVAP